MRDDAALRNLLKRFADHIYFHFLYKKHHQVERVAGDLLPLIDDRSRQGLAQAALKLAAIRWQLPLLGHEDPVFMYDLEKVVDLYPGCKLIQIVRDPRTSRRACSSSLGDQITRSSPPTIGIGLIGIARRLGARLGAQRYLEFRYEDLLTKPAETMTALLQFVVGSVDSSKVAAFERETAINPLRRNFGNWQKDLTPQQVQLVESAAQEQMAEFGYQPEYPERHISSCTNQDLALHHRAVQVCNIVFGKLHINGLGKIDPPSPLRGPKRLQEVVTH